MSDMSDIPKPELVTLSRECYMGLIGHHKSQHYECQNRACECLCHKNLVSYPKSWKLGVTSVAVSDGAT